MEQTRPGPDAPAVLVIISDQPDLSATVRAGQREVRRWSADGRPPGRGTEERCFTGDPEDAGTFAWTAAASAVTAVVELGDVARAYRVATAVREVRPDAAVLILCDGCDEAPGDGTLARSGRLRDVLRLDVDDELKRLEAQRRLYCLRRFAEGTAVVPILVHSEPDPDAVASALAVRTLLRRGEDDAPIVTLAGNTRPENRLMKELLHIRVTEIAVDELRGFERVIAVDMQPAGIARAGLPRFAVIDHHPLESDYSAEYADIRVGVGAAATLLVEYLRADDPRRVNDRLGTALLYGIRTDTQSLTRGVTAMDVEAYAFLQGRADPVLLRRFERGTYTHDAAVRFGLALERSRMEEDVIVAWLGAAPDDAHGLADLADFCLSVEGVSCAVAGAIAGDLLTLAIRYQGKGAGAGELARRIADDGDGGGHATMARVSWPARRALDRLGARDAGDDDAILSGILKLVLRERTSPAGPVHAGGSVVDDDAELVR